ncbi:MAG TPA: ribonuclease H [Polyangiaceae bacterium]
MPWVRALLHGQVVFARARPDGSLLVAGDRVEVCYSPNASRLYRARARNVVRQNDATVLPEDACAPRLDSAPRLKSAPIMMRSVTKKPAQSTAMPKVSKDTIVAFADGACSGNPGPAGLGVVVLDAGTRTEISEHLGQATNNIAELTAIERVLDLVPEGGRPLVIYTDSAYAIGVLSKGWKAKANLPLVERVRDRLAKRPATRLFHVRGHSGIELNERADELAREAVRTGRSRSERVG